MLGTLKPLRYAAGLLPALGLVLWMGLSGDTTTYARSPAEIHSALKAARVPTHVLGEGVAGSRVRSDGENRVITALVDPAGVELVLFVTTVDPDGEGSQVSTVVQMAPGDRAQEARDALKKNAIATALLEKLADEHVAAAIEERPFDMLFAAPPGAAQMISATPGMRDKIDDANASASDFAKTQQEWAEHQREEEFREQYGDDWGASGADSSDGWGD